MKMMITMATKVNGQGAPISLACVIMNKTTMIVITLKRVALIFLMFLCANLFYSNFGLNCFPMSNAFAKNFPRFQ
jgi:hypothetical protein